MTRFKWLALSPLLLALSAMSFAADRNALIGSWRLVSFEREYQATGEREYPMGNTPTGTSASYPTGAWQW